MVKGGGLVPGTVGWGGRGWRGEREEYDEMDGDSSASSTIHLSADERVLRKATR